MTAHERIWLEPAEQSDPFIGRSWCQDNQWGHEGVEYVLASTLESLQSENAALRGAQTYTYIGRDGKSVLARDLEDRAEAAEAEVKRLQAEIDRKSSMPADHRYWEGRYRDEAAENERLNAILEPFLREAKRLGLSSLCPDRERLTVIVTAKEMRDALSVYKRRPSDANANQAIAAVEALLSIDDTAEYQQGIIDAASAIRALASTGGEHNAE